ncbi:MAG: Zn-dependent exopeptidase M28 [Chloroflexi bacterium]|nr:Zn-dependent exopeptidase M28 [Chloroflexota bacterium]
MRDQIESDIRGWDAIHDHRTGTAGDAATTEWLAGLVRGAGAEPHVDAFPFERRAPRECSVTVDGRTAPGLPLFDGGLTDAAGLSGPLTGLADGPGTPGGIALARYESSGGAATEALLHARKSGRHAGIVAIAEGRRVEPGLAPLNADAFGAPFGPPALQVGSEHADWLEAAAARDALARLTAHMRIEQTVASNVQARVAGARPALAPLVIMTPISAWWTGTAERAGGVAVWLACLRHIAAERPERDVVFAANTGHELGHVGLHRFLRANPGLGAGAHAWIHLGANVAARGGALRCQASDEALLRLATTEMRQAGVAPESVAPLGRRPGGEARDVYDAGGRYVSLVGGNRWFHHPDDRWPHTIDIDKAERVVEAALAIAGELARGRA